jgi:tetratricopeptide (TPR) repeat protein
MRRLAAVRTCAAAALALAVPVAVLGAPPAKSDSGAVRHDANNVTGISGAMEAIVAGSAKYEQKDFAGALELFTKATKLAPRNALAFYCVGAAQLANGNLPDAEAAFRQADSVGDATPSVKAKALFAIADVLERQKKYEDAKAAWQRYLDFAGKTDAGAFPASGTARVTALDEVIKLDKAYEVVRQRIAAEKEKDGGK